MKYFEILIVLVLAIVPRLSATLTPTTSVLSSWLNPSAYGQVVNFSAVVTSDLGTPPDGEMVTLEQGSKILGKAPLSAGTAIFMIATLTRGADDIKAIYPGDSNFAKSTSNVVEEIVDKAPTSTTLASSENPSNVGQAVTLTAIVTPQYSGTATGTVTFNSGNKKLGTVTLSRGVATIKTSGLAVGSDSITAVYNGSNTCFDSNTGLTQTVGAGAFTYPTMTWNGITRYYEVFVPTVLAANPAMLLMLHGTRITPSTGSDPTPVITLNWGWQSYANRYEFILVQPASTFDPSSNQWNWNSFCMDGTTLCNPYGANGGAFSYAEDCGSADGECPDDIGFLGNLITTLTAQYGVNPNTIYVTGFSAGAQMTERVGVELSGLVAAIAPVSGPLVNAQGTVPPPLPLPTSVPSPFPPISVMEWQGTKDENLWPCDYGTTNYSNVVFTVGTVDDTFNYWVQQDQCSTVETTQTLCLNGSPNNASDYPSPGIPGDTGNLATGCAVPPGGQNIEVQFVWEPGIAHTWNENNIPYIWSFLSAQQK
ncbi:MAG: Ig-like domain repeat protein [Candidatus Sulfotelmatobacter sp.]